MISTPTTVLSSGDTTNSSSYTTASTVLTAGRLYIIVIGGYRVSGAVNAASIIHDVSGTSTNFARISDGVTDAVAQGFGDTTRRIVAAWSVIPGSTTASAPITVNWTSTQSSMSWHLLEIASGFDATTTFPQVKAAISSVTGTTIDPGTMGSFGSSDNMLLFAMAIGTGTGNPTQTIANNESRVELDEHGDGERTRQATHYQNPNGGDTTINATISGSTHWGAIGIEIAATAGGAAGQPYIKRVRGVPFSSGITGKLGGW
jgi:hypothetical protein